MNLRDSGATWDSNYSAWYASSSGDPRASTISTNTDYSLLSQLSVPSGPSPTFQNNTRYPTFGPAPPPASPSSSTSVVDKKANNIHVCPCCGNTYSKGPDFRKHFKTTCSGLGACCEAWLCSCCNHFAPNEFQAQKHQKTHSHEHQGPSYAELSSPWKGQSACSEAWACTCCNHVAREEHLAQEHQDTHGPLHQGSSYTKLSLPLKERFTCCHHERVFGDVEAFLDHLTKDCNLRKFPVEADHRYRIRTLLQDGRDQPKDGSQHSYIHAAVLQWCRSHGLPEDAWTQVINVGSSAAAKEVADKLERGLVQRNSENYAILSRLGFTSVHEAVDSILSPLLSPRHVPTVPGNDDVQARSGEMQPQVPRPQQYYPVPVGQTGTAPQQRLPAQVVQGLQWQPPLHYSLVQQPLHQAQPSPLHGHSAPSHQSRSMRPPAPPQDHPVSGQRRPTGPHPWSASAVDTVQSSDQAQAWPLPGRYEPAQIQGQQVYPQPSYGIQATPNAYEVRAGPLSGPEFASHATYAPPTTLQRVTAVNVDSDVGRNTNRSGPEATGAWRQVTQEIESGAANPVTFRGPWPMQQQQQAPSHPQGKKTIPQYGPQAAHGRHAFLSPVQEVASEDPPNAAGPSMSYSGPQKGGLAATSEKRTVSRLSLTSQVIPESLARRDVLSNQRAVYHHRLGAHRSETSLDPVFRTANEGSSRKLSETDNLLSYDASFGPNEAAHAASSPPLRYPPPSMNSAYLPTAPLPPVPVNTQVTPPIDRPKTPKDKIKDFFNRSPSNSKVLELQDVDPSIIFGNHAAPRIDLEGPAGNQSLKLSCPQCGQGAFASQDLLATHTTTMHPPAATSRREKRQGRFFQ